MMDAWGVLGMKSWCLCEGCDGAGEELLKGVKKFNLLIKMIFSIMYYNHTNVYLVLTFHIL